MLVREFIIAPPYLDGPAEDFTSQPKSGRTQRLSSALPALAPAIQPLKMRSECWSAAREQAERWDMEWWEDSGLEGF